MLMGMFDIWKRDPDSPDIVILPPVLFALGFLGGYALDIWWGWSFGVGPAQALGWPLVVGGGLLAVWAAWHFKKAGTNIPPNQPTLSLVVEGPYRVTRNPMYVALAIVHVGLSALVDAPAALLTLAIILPVLHQGIVLREEAYLEVKFGEPYRQFMQRTKRYL